MGVTLTFDYGDDQIDNHEWVQDHFQKWKHAVQSCRMILNENHENMLSEALAFLGQNIKDLAHSHIKLTIIIFSNEAQGKNLQTPTPWLPAHESCR